MSDARFSPDQITRSARLSPADLIEIRKRRRDYNRLGFAYQLAFVRLTNQLPRQQPLEVIAEVLTFVALQLNLPETAISEYQRRRQTIGEHGSVILNYLKLRPFGEAEAHVLADFLFEAACRLEQTGPLLLQAKLFLKEKRILYPADDTLRRLIVTQRQAARNHIFSRITTRLSLSQRKKLDDLLVVGRNRRTPFQLLKRPPGQPSPKSMLQLAENLQRMQDVGVMTLDLTWLNNNYQRSLTRYAQRCSADRLRDLQDERRYAVLVCFLWQTYRDTLDHMVDMHDKLMLRVYNRAQEDINVETRQQRRMIRSSLQSFHRLGHLILDYAIPDTELRALLLHAVDRERLAAQVAAAESWLTGKYSHVFNLVLQRFYYLRQYAPTFLESLTFQVEAAGSTSLIQAIQLLRDMNQAGKRKLPAAAPLSFIPKKLRPFVESDGEVHKPAWECALLTAIRDELKAGNIYVRQSKRFGRFADFFITERGWETQRERFFQQAGLPDRPEDVAAFLTARLNQAFDHFLEQLPHNTYAAVGDQGWQLAVDPGSKLELAEQQRLETLQTWLAEKLRDIKLPELLIEVDNELHFTDPFTPLTQHREAEQVCAVLAAIMAHGCNVGPYTMARLTDDITYRQIKRITDWQLTEAAQREALAVLVNAISQLDVTQAWGAGKTSSSDGQRFRLPRKVLQRTYSQRLRDYALEFYSFVADNYAPFYSTVIECTDRDAAYVLDGLLYNESDLALEEHYTDTHGYTEINFAAFAMLGRRFAPRIRGLQHQRIYRIDQGKDYGPLASLVARGGHTIHLDWICEQWDRMGQFYASLESGHTTASIALKRLAAYSGKNHFYRANRELGRIFKTEYILQYMSDPAVRSRVRRGLLKGEEIHALARQVAYGKQGRITARELHAQQNTSGCLTLIMACIIYWQAKEINRTILEGEPEAVGVDLSLLEHISPIGWENIILYGQYVLNRDLVQL
jgi:TnpA family transposase